MAKKFNITGTCIPGRHYMADISAKLDNIMELVTEGDYFTINRPRQYGKSTVLFLLEQRLGTEKKYRDYLPLDISFESIDSKTYENQELFISTFLDILSQRLEFLREKELLDIIRSAPPIPNFNGLSTLFTRLVNGSGRKVVLMIDEVDKSANNQLFLDFLGMLRTKYLKRNEGKDFSFHSVILAGVHDIKNLKAKFPPDGKSKPDDKKSYNSPWNIAVDFDVELSLSIPEIASMLEDYSNERQVKIDIPYFSRTLFYYTSGYPFIVSFLCKLIDEKILPGEKENQWHPNDLLRSVQLALMADSTNFDSLIKNLENNPDLYELVYKIIMNGGEFSYNPRNPLISLGTLYGILRKDRGKTRIHNRFYEQLVYDYMASKLETGTALPPGLSSMYVRENGSLDMEKIIRKFQEFMKIQYSARDAAFIERNGRLLFLAFIKPIINGKGFDFKEVQVSEEKRLDVVIVFGNRTYIVELKIWRGQAYHKEGINQLNDYLDRQNQHIGYLLIYDPRKETARSGEWEEIKTNGKTIRAAWV